MLQAALMSALLVAGGFMVMVGAGMALKFIPGLAEIVGDVLWAWVGTTDTFELAADLLKNGIGNLSFSGEDFGMTMVAMISSAVLEVIILGVCVFFVKSFFVRVSTFFVDLGQKSRPKLCYRLSLTRPVWLMTVLGIVLGVAVLRGSDALLGRLSELLSVALTIGLLLWGVWKMLTAGQKKWHGRPGYRQAVERFAGGMLAGIIADVLCAVIGVLLLTCVLRSPELITSVAGFLMWLLWIVVCLAAMCLVEVLAGLLTPR